MPRHDGICHLTYTDSVVVRARALCGADIRERMLHGYNPPDTHGLCPFCSQPRCGDCERISEGDKRKELDDKAPA